MGLPIGKLIVATTEGELDGLWKYKKQAEANGVDDLRMLTPGELKEMEPAVRCVAGFLSPSTGIIDSHGLMLSYLGEAEELQLQLANVPEPLPIQWQQEDADGWGREAA